MAEPSELSKSIMNAVVNSKTMGFRYDREHISNLYSGLGYSVEEVEKCYDELFGPPAKKLLTLPGKKDRL